MTDPPYQLDSIRKRFGTPGSAPAKDRDGLFKRVSRGFMGKEWDVLPPTEVWIECLRVLKPGGFAFIMCTPRQDSLVEAMCRVRDAGFVMGFTPIFWCYATGLVKGHNIAKAVDRKLGQVPEELPTEIMPKRSEVGAKLRDNRRCKVCGKPLVSGNPCRCDRTYKPQTDEARALQGSYGGFQPKPAVEIILVAMKPLSEDTYVQQALENRKGITWLDDVRIPHISEDDKSTKPLPIQNSPTGRIFGFKHGEGRSGEYSFPNDKGRFPANLLVSDDVFKDHQDKGTPPHPVTSNVDSYEGYGSITHKNGEVVNYGDAGSFSRYFSLDAWWDNTSQFLEITKPSTWERNFGLPDNGRKNPRPQGTAFNDEESDYSEIIDRGNYHPTVKPIKLMSYLITMGSREGDVVLDPYLGSGTTAIAALLLGRSFVGIDIDPEYCQIASKRIGFYLKNQGHDRFIEIKEEVVGRRKLNEFI